MSYKKGDMFFYDFPKRKTEKIEKTGVIYDEHRVVVLHKRETPHKTVLVAPITEPKNLIRSNAVPKNYVKLKKDDYPCMLTKDSYINLDHIMPIDEGELLKVSKKGVKILGTLKEVDLYQVDFKLMLTYELQDFFENEKALDNNANIQVIIDHIDINVKKEIEELMDQFDIKEEEQRNKFINALDSLIDILKEYYIKEDAEEGKYLKNK